MTDLPVGQRQRSPGARTHNLEPLADVRFGADSGLKLDIRKVP